MLPHNTVVQFKWTHSPWKIRELKYVFFLLEAKTVFTKQFLIVWLLRSSDEVGLSCDIARWRSSVFITTLRTPRKKRK